jgi:hypothetical protein
MKTPWMPDGKAPSIHERAPIRNHELMALMQSHAELLAALKWAMPRLQEVGGDENPEYVEAMAAIDKAEGK